MFDFLFKSELDTNSPEHAARIGYRVIALGLGGFVLWAALVPLSEGVPSPGFVAIDSKRLAVQHLQGGVIREVLVHEGQQVKQGDVLVRLDEVASRALYETARQNLASLYENIEAQKAMLEGYQKAEKNRKAQLALIERELSGLTGLVKDGYAPLTQQLQLERSLADIRTALSDAQASRARTQQSILELNHQISAAKEKLQAAEQDFTRLDIRSQSDGQVVGLSVQSTGAVIQPAQKIMDIVPLDRALVLEARIASNLIDRVHVGDNADIRFTGFTDASQLVVDGEVLSISHDVLHDPSGTQTQQQQPYYLARVGVTPQGLAKLGGRVMQPGMQVEVIVQTGSRTLLQYLLHPLTKRVAASLQEH
jgi:membrane fusion protein, protease secretion system